LPERLFGFWLNRPPWVPNIGLMVTNVSSLAKPARRAREHLPVRVAIGIWITFGLAGPFCLALAPNDRAHATIVFACSLAALGWAAMAAWLPSDERLAFLYPVSTLSGIGMAAASVAATGGASSPMRAGSMLFVAYAAAFLPRRAGAATVACAVASSLLPLLYGGRGPVGSVVASTLTQTAILAVAGVTIMLVCRRLSDAVAVEANRLETIVALHREVEETEFDVVEVVLGILERARTLLDASAASAGILEGEEVVYRYRTGPGRNSDTVIRTPANASLSGICLRTGEPAFCEDSELDPRVDKAACRAQALRSMIIVPLRHRGRVVGVLNVNSPQPRAFGTGDVVTVQLIGGAISAAYGHAVDIAAKQELLTELELTVTDLRDTERKLSHQALHDPLTGLPNRTFFVERLESALGRHGEDHTAVLFVDLDGFKLINDALGHAAGDALLIEAGERIKGSLRSDDTAARLGGDEFAIICTAESPSRAAKHIAERLISALAAPFPIAGREVFVTASVGIAASGGSADSLLRDADVAMYHAKTAGKNRYETFSSEMHGDVSIRLELEASVQTALAQGQFILHYQPIVDLQESCVTGAEALIRWEHPERGLLPPGVFIPLLEETGQIKAVGRWVLREACRQMASWQAELECPGHYVSVNLSAHQLGDAEIVAEVRAALDESGLAPQSLVLELTESAIMRDIELTASRLDTLKELGVRIAVDDFGTAYSSLQYLHQLPVDVLKIAKPFIDALAAADGDAVVPRAITELGHQLRLDMVAEGIEHSEQLERLQELGCPHGQGFLFSTPLPAQQMRSKLAALPASVALGTGDK
jgi:diguanylate cyclase (GGDEF)-like protein